MTKHAFEKLKAAFFIQMTLRLASQSFFFHVLFRIFLMFCKPLIFPLKVCFVLLDLYLKRLRQYYLLFGTSEIHIPYKLLIKKALLLDYQLHAHLK